MAQCQLLSRKLPYRSSSGQKKRAQIDITQSDSEKVILVKMAPGEDVIVPSAGQQCQLCNGRTLIGRFRSDMI